MKCFSAEKINTGRQPELDLIKAVCIIGMIFVHVYLDCGKGLPSSIMEDYLTEFFGAATFMVCMGIGMRYSRNQSAKGYCIRGFGLLTVGQILNLVRNVLPNLIAWWILGDQFFIANSLLVIQSDILSFAGLAFLLMALFKKVKMSDGQVLAAGVALSVVALISWNLLESPKNYLLSQLLGYFVLTNAESYFPLFGYFIFVAFGYFIGGWYPRICDKDGLSNRILLICLPIAAAYYIPRFLFEFSFMPELGSDAQYNLKPTPDAIATCLVTLALLALFYKITKLFNGKLPAWVMHFSENINTYYCLSYVLILPFQTILVAVWGRLMPGIILPALYSLAVCIACYWLIEFRKKYIHIHPLRGKSGIIIMAAAWILTVAVIVYAYPKIEVFANIWNEYLLP